MFDDRTGRFYGVQQQIGDEWRTVYGWFPVQVAEPGDEPGLIRARRCLRAIRADQPDRTWRLAWRDVEIGERQEIDSDYPPSPVPSVPDTQKD